MGERAVIERGMESLEAIGESDSTTFVLPQELTSLVGRYGKHLTGSDASLTESMSQGEGLETQDFDAETRELLGLDDINEILGEIDAEADIDIEAMEEEAEAIKTGTDEEMANPEEASTGGETSTEPTDTERGAATDGEREEREELETDASTD
jgi:hypothetical protein